MRSCKFLFLLLVFLLLVGCSSNRLIFHGGELSGDQFWQGRVEVTGDLELLAGSQLTIAPGTEILFFPPPAELDRYRDHPHFAGSELILRGIVRADGRPDAPIIFRASDPAASAGSWGGVNVVASPTASFSHVLFQSADSALHVQESTASIEHCIFRNNLVGVRFHSSRIRIENNLFAKNGSGVRFHFGAPVIDRNIFQDNDKSLFITSSPAAYLIENNNFLSTRNYHVVLGEEVSLEVSLPGNWWGSTDPERIESSFFDGRRDSHLGRITYLPALVTPLAGVGPGWH